MLIDARLLPANEVIETEVCVVGTGPAGLSLAREFLGQGFRVCLLESGGLEQADANISSLAEVKTAGDFVQINGRHRQFGGNSNYWAIALGDGQIGLRHRPLDQVDFEQRDWIPYSGWPFNRDDLQPYYERAHATFQIGRFAYEGHDWEDAQHPQFPFVGDRVTTRMFQFSRSKVFFETYRELLRQAPNLTTYLHATVTQLETDETAGTITRAQVACLNGNRFSVAARFFVLAVGGVESAQLLLLSSQTQKQGLGNQHDLVGRFFMDHPLVYGGLLIPSDPQIFSKAGLYDLRSVDGSYVMGTLGLTDEVMRREKLVNISASLFPRSKYSVLLPAKNSLRSLLNLQAFRTGTALQHVKTVLTGMDGLANAVYGKLTRHPEPLWYNFFVGGWADQQVIRQGLFHVFEVVHQTEQLPNPHNRAKLSDEMDLLGRRRILMETEWRQDDIDGIIRAQNVLAQEIARAGLGRFKIARHNNRPIMTNAGTAHHIGTTRMHVDPRQGVVDPNCKVHSVSNLFIASSAVFPTGGYANPTLTVVALSIRLADHIKTLMNQSLELDVSRNSSEQSPQLTPVSQQS